MNGSRLKELRLQKGFSQEYVAELMHVVRQTVSNWEREKSSLSADQLQSLSSLYGVSLAQFFGSADDISNEHHTTLMQTAHAESSKDDSHVAVKKEEMITSITNRLEEMNETGVTALYDFITLFPLKERWMASTSKERIAELDAIKAQREQEAAQEKERAAKEAEAKATEKREQIYRDYAGMFSAIKKVKIPTRYDLSIGEIEAIDFVCGEISRCFPEYAYSVASKYFDYGFVKGMRYATAQSKKK